MLITEENSSLIIQKIGKILKKNINIMDAEGKIVASTDKKRIGTFHQAAKELIARNVHEIDVYSDDKLTGSKEGINVPIFIKGNTIGVVGVTGNPDELRDIALIIGEMASIFFIETFQSREKEIERRRHRHYWEELIYNTHQQENEAFIRRGKELGIFVQKIRSIAQLYLPENLSEGKRGQINENLIVALKKNLDTRILMHHYGIGEKNILFLIKEPSEEIIGLLSEALDSVRKKFNVPIYCGISGGCRSYIHVNRIYAQADKAVEVAYHAGVTDICVYESLALEILLNQLTHESKSAYIQHIWRNVESEECIKMMDFLVTYFECNGSIQEIANRLFIHKNTVQYRIHKIFEATGYDPRKLNDAILLNLSIRLRIL